MLCQDIAHQMVFVLLDFMDVVSLACLHRYLATFLGANTDLNKNTFISIGTRQLQEQQLELNPALLAKLPLKKVKRILSILAEIQGPQMQTPLKFSSVEEIDAVLNEACEAQKKMHG